MPGSPWPDHQFGHGFRRHRRMNHEHVRHVSDVGDRGESVAASYGSLEKTKGAIAFEFEMPITSV